MKPQLVLSLFPGIGLLDMAFEEAGFCVVRGPDVLFGGDIRRFHPLPGRFDGVIGGPPCQWFSRLAHMVRQSGYEPKFGNLIPEFERCVLETGPTWFLMEEVPDAPLPCVEGYEVHAFLLNNRQLGEVQNRVRRWSFGYRGERRVLMVETVALEPSEFEYAATGGSARPVAIGGSGQRKKFRDGKGRMPFNSKSTTAFRDLCQKQGLADGFDLPPFTVEAKCKAVGNGVPLPMGRAIAAAVKLAIGAFSCGHENGWRR
jgi:DNA (cytosine-5)-methyltransferase 1